MAEKSLLIRDEAGALPVNLALRDAYVNDPEDNARIIQRMCWANLHFPSPTGTPTRDITSSDPSDIDSSPAELWNNIVLMGDKSRLILFCDFTSTGTTGYLDIRLLFCDSSNKVLGISPDDIEMQRSDVRDPTRAAGDQIHVVPLVAVCSELYGAARIAVYVRNSTSMASAKIWAFPI